MHAYLIQGMIWFIHMKEEAAIDIENDNTSEQTVEYILMTIVFIFV